MNNKKKYNGFSLAEALITLFIVSIVTVSAAPTLTKMKSKAPPDSPHGQFACWQDMSGTIRQQRAVERSMEPAKIVPKCTFEPDVRISAHYIIMIAGGGGTGIQGQYISLYVPEIKNNITDIVPGAPGQSTRIALPFDIEAMGGVASANNGLVAKNIKSCILRTKSCGEATSCDLITSSRLSGGTPEYVVKTNGCTMKDPANAQITITRMDRLTDFTKNNNGSYKSKSTGMEYDFQMEDTLFAARKAGDSKMKEVMGTIPLHRRSTFFTTVSALNPGGLNRPGAVFIVW